MFNLFCKLRFRARWLLFFSSISIISHIVCMELAVNSASTVMEKANHVPFLFRLFGLPAELTRLPNDVQREIVKKLPIAFKPFRPKPVENIHDDLNWKDVTDITFNSDGTRFAVIAPDKSRNDSWPFTKLCIDSMIVKPNPQAEVITFEGQTTNIAFNKDGTQLLLLMYGNATLLTLADGKIIEQRELELPSQFNNHFPERTGISALSDGTFLIACLNKHIMILDPSTDKLTTLHDPTNFTNKRYIRFSIFVHEDTAIIAYYDILSKTQNTPELFDIQSKSWFLMPEILADTGYTKVDEICYNSNKSLLLATYSGIKDSSASTSGKMHNLVYLWDMTGQVPQLSKLCITGSSCLCFRPDSLYALIYNSCTKSLRLYSVATGAYIADIPCKMPELFLFRPNMHVFSPKGDTIITRHEHSLNIWKWNPLWDECASFFEKPMLIEQYLFIMYLHQLSSCGLTLNDKGACAQDRYKHRFTEIICPLMMQDLKELKEVFGSFGPAIQKYLRLKYHLSW